MIVHRIPDGCPEGIGLIGKSGPFIVSSVQSTHSSSNRQCLFMMWSKIHKGMPLWAGWYDLADYETSRITSIQVCTKPGVRLGGLIPLVFPDASSPKYPRCRRHFLHRVWTLQSDRYQPAVGAIGVSGDVATGFIGVSMTRQSIKRKHLASRPLVRLGYLVGRSLLELSMPRVATWAQTPARY